MMANSVFCDAFLLYIHIRNCQKPPVVEYIIEKSDKFVLHAEVILFKVIPSLGENTKNNFRLPKEPFSELSTFLFQTLTIQHKNITKIHDSNMHLMETFDRWARILCLKRYANNVALNDMLIMWPWRFFPHSIARVTSLSTQKLILCELHLAICSTLRSFIEHITCERLIACAIMWWDEFFPLMVIISILSVSNCNVISIFHYEVPWKDFIDVDDSSSDRRRQ